VGKGHSHTLFVADLHLCDERPQINRLFFSFLEAASHQAEALYILGDLFESWIGDDDLQSPLNRQVADALMQLSSRGVACFFLHGNRDFLVAGDFAAASGLGLLPDPSLIDLYGQPTLLMHGDTLCTDDIAYQAFRRQVRDPAWQSEFLARPFGVRKAVAVQLREKSEQQKQIKAAEIMDVNLEAVANTFRRFDYPRLIHGHTHRPARHVHTVDGETCERWVLPDWYEAGGYLDCSAEGCRLMPART
jgi:UDP-2,3-diacylglucosamine hydrolase